MGCDNSTTVPIVWQSSSVFGRVAGYMIMGILGDWIGRKVVIFISCALSPITALIVATSNYYMVFVVSNAINGFFDGGFSVCLVLILEITSNNRRSEFLIIACCSFALGIGKKNLQNIINIFLFILNSNKPLNIYHHIIFT